MTSRSSNSAVSSRTTGAIASYMARVSSQSRTFFTSRARTIPEVVNFRIFGFRSCRSSIDKQSSIYAVRVRCRLEMHVLRCETTIAIARANSCGFNSLIRILPLTGGVDGRVASSIKWIHGCAVINRRTLRIMAGFCQKLAAWLHQLNVNGASSFRFVNRRLADAIQ